MSFFEAVSQLNTINSMITDFPMAVDQESRLLMKIKLKDVFQKICSHIDSSPELIRRTIKDLSLLELAHVNIGVHEKISKTKLSCTPLVSIKDHLSSEAIDQLSQLISQQLSLSLTERFSSMSKNELKEFISARARFDAWDGNSHPRFLRHFMRQNPKILVGQILKSNPVRILEAIRLLEEPLSASFVYNKKMQENYVKLRALKNRDVDTSLIKALKCIYQCLREYENFGHVNDERDLERADMHFEVVKSKLLAWRGSSEHDFFQSSRTKAELTTNALDQLYKIYESLKGNNYGSAVENIRFFEIRKTV